MGVQMLSGHVGGRGEWQVCHTRPPTRTEPHCPFPPTTERLCPRPAPASSVLVMPAALACGNIKQRRWCSACSLMKQLVCTRLRCAWGVAACRVVWRRPSWPAACDSIHAVCRPLMQMTPPLLFLCCVLRLPAPCNMPSHQRRGLPQQGMAAVPRMAQADPLLWWSTAPRLCARDLLCVRRGQGRLGQHARARSFASGRADELRHAAAAAAWASPWRQGFPSLALPPNLAVSGEIGEGLAVGTASAAGGEQGGRRPPPPARRQPGSATPPAIPPLPRRIPLFSHYHGGPGAPSSRRTEAAGAQAASHIPRLA